MTQGELFPDPRVPRPRMATPPGAARYVRRPRGGQWCDDCVRDIHLRGLAYADPVRRATWARVRAGERTDLLCEIHKNRRQELER